MCALVRYRASSLSVSIDIQRDSASLAKYFDLFIFLSFFSLYKYIVKCKKLKNIQITK